MLLESPIRYRVALAVFGVAFIATASFIVAYSAFVPSDGITVAVGQVAPADILSPSSITYESEVLTRLSRQAAADAVRDVYDPPNPSVLRQQIQLARHVLDYIESVRHDSFAQSVQQTADLTAITAIHLTEPVASKLLALSDNAWKEVDEQVTAILERTLRVEVREDNIRDIYANLPNLVSITVNETQTDLITALLQQLIKPNTFYNGERTKEAQRQAADKVAPETRSFAQGQIVVRAGSIVSEADMEALTQLRVLQPPDRRGQMLTGAFLAVLLVSSLGAIYLRSFHADVFHDLSTMILIGVLFLVFLAGARIFGSATNFQSHLYPAAALSLILVALAGPQAAAAITVGLALLIGLIIGNSFEFASLVAIGGAAGILSLRHTERLNTYFAAGLVIGLVDVAVSLFFLLIQGSVDPGRVVTVLTAGLLNGMLSAGLAIVGLYLIGNALNVPTNVRLLELSQPNQPLLQRLLREAPGTYQHSLQVANLAELAAERIGANAMLTRVGALYHDIGKVVAPHFYVENQVEGENAHDAINDPQRSAAIIIAHVTEGERLARKHRLPVALIDFIWQHHGTLPVLYFYTRALEAVQCDVSKVDKAVFSYPGPTPQTREAAIMMLADTSESVVRAKRPHNRQEMENIIGEIFESRLADGQLDHSRLSVNDLKAIREVFVSTLQGVFHPRLAYPALPSTQTGEYPALPQPSAGATETRP